MEQPNYCIVEVQVFPADPGQATLLNTLVSTATGKEQPDVIPHTGPGDISFRHAFFHNEGAKGDPDTLAAGMGHLVAEDLPDGAENSYHLIPLGAVASTHAYVWSHVTAPPTLNSKRKVDVGHVFMDAADVDDVYDRGYDLMLKTGETHPDNSAFNDYAIELPGRPE